MQLVLAPLQFRGPMSTFGGVGDTGIKPKENLAFPYTPEEIETLTDPYGKKLFLPLEKRPDKEGIADWLDRYGAMYIACRWDYTRFGRTTAAAKAWLKKATIQLVNPANKKIVLARPADWGPHGRTKRIADLSDLLASSLNLKTDQIVEVRFQYPKLR